MAINFTDFSRAPLLDAPGKNIFEDVLKGYQISQEPAKMREEQKQRELTNQLKDLEVKHKPKEYELSDQGKRLANSLQDLALKHKPKEYTLSDALKQSQIDKNNRPGGSGTAAKANGKLANFVYSHPDATQDEIKEFADTLSKAELDHLRQTTARGAKLNETQYKRDSTPIVKKHDELRSIDEGKFPGTDDKITPEKQTNMKNDLLLSLVKDVTDPKTRERLMNASNMNITLDSINPINLTKYSGGEGQINKMADGLIEAFGEGSPEFQNYRKEVIKATAASKQMRQYLGDSIQPSAQEKLDHLANPEAWNVSPKLAKENFEFIRDLYKRETQTLVRAATDPSLYTPQGNAETNSHVGKTYNLATKRWE